MAFKREKRLTRKERQETSGKGPSGTPSRQAGTVGASDGFSDPRLPDGAHIHCVACGKHLETVGEARARKATGFGSTLWINVRCAHGSAFQACMGCVDTARELLAEHDRTGEAVRAAEAWH